MQAKTDLVLQYGSGNGYIMPMESDNVTFEDAPLITFPVPASGQSHPHMSYQYNDEVFVPDLVSCILFHAGHRG